MRKVRQGSEAVVEAEVMGQGHADFQEGLFHHATAKSGKQGTVDGIAKPERVLENAVHEGAVCALRPWLFRRALVQFGGDGDSRFVRNLSCGLHSATFLALARAVPRPQPS